jgi:hypothetical protein
MGVEAALRMAAESAVSAMQEIDALHLPEMRRDIHRATPKRQLSDLRRHGASRTANA